PAPCAHAWLRGFRVEELLSGRLSRVTETESTRSAPAGPTSGRESCFPNRERTGPALRASGNTPLFLRSPRRTDPEQSADSAGERPGPQTRLPALFCRSLLRPLRRPPAACQPVLCQGSHPVGPVI